MDKSEKQVVIDDLHAKLAKASFVAAIKHDKLDAFTDIDLRKAMRAAKIDFKVVKNKLALRAAKGTSAEKLAAHFEGPVAVAIAYDDLPAAAKALTTFFKTKPNMLTVKGAVVDGALVDASGVDALAKMPGLPELRATLLALINTPATTLVRLINTPGTQVVRVLQAKADKPEAA